MGRASLIAGCARALFLAVVVVAVLLPFYCMFVTSIRPKEAAFELVPRDVSFAVYAETLKVLAPHVRNSFAIATVTVACTIALGAAAAYGLARFRFFGRRMVAQSFLLAYAFPAVLLIIPLYVLWHRLGLRGWLPGLLPAYLAQTLPVAVYLFHNYFASQDESVEEAALLDGCSPLGVILHVTIPTSLPAVAAVGLFAFVVVWNEFLFAFRLLLGNERAATLPVKLYALRASAHFPWPQLMAASLIMILPMLLVVALGQRYFEQGVVSASKN